MTKRFIATLKAICMALVLFLALLGELLQWPPQVLIPAFLAIFGAPILLQGIFRAREASRLKHRRVS